MTVVGAWSSPPVLGAVAVVAVLLIGVVSRVGVASGGLATADYLVRARSGSGDHVAAGRIRAAVVWQGLTVAGLAVLAAVAGGRLATLGPPSDELVAATVGLCLLARAQLVPQLWTRAIAMLAGLAVLGIGVWRLSVDRPSGALWLAPLGVAAVAALLIPASRGRGWPARPARLRLLIWLEATAVMAMVCASAVAAGLPGAVHTLIGSAPRVPR
jgi:hypothetical protein